MENGTVTDIVIPAGNKSGFYSAYAVILAMLAAAAVGYLQLPRADMLLPLVADCRLDRQICSAALPDGGRLEVSLEPRPVSTITPIRVSVSIAGLPAGRVEVEFQGVDMNMGLQRLPLVSAGSGRFSGETTLPVCVTGQMVWQATILIEADRKNISVPFRFESGA